MGTSFQLSTGRTAMNCGMRLGIVGFLASGLFIGCGKSGTPDAPVANSGGPAAASPATAVQPPDPSSSPIAQAAYDFVDAVVKGDTQRASARLTPQAMQRIIASKDQFNPTGLPTATFRLGEIRAPSPTQAVVECIFTDNSQGAPQTDEMCCVLRKVDNDWRVAGIAYGTAADKPWVLNDFESGKSFPIPRQTMGGMASTPTAGQQPGNVVMQTGATQPPVAPQTQPGMPPVAAQYNAPPAAPAPNGLGMPAVAAPPANPNAAPYQSQAPYTAQEPQSSGLR
jgi:hypothetical protein